MSEPLKLVFYAPTGTWRVVDGDQVRYDGVSFNDALAVMREAGFEPVAPPTDDVTLREIAARVQITREQIEASVAAPPGAAWRAAVGEPPKSPEGVGDPADVSPSALPPGEIPKRSHHKKR